ncbi:MAG: hypothetical protein KIT14_12475 [bacterium]|nr:hypothetical protein [bacterium]
MRHAASLLGAVLLAAALPAAAVAQTIDGTVCYKARDTAPRGTYDVTFLGQTCRVKTPAKLACLTERDAAVTPAPPASSTLDPAPTLLCYRARCRPPAVRPATLADAFGVRGVTLRAGRFLCLPAGGAETITTTTTVPGSVTTTTRPANTCGFEDRMCGGSCPNRNQRCSFAGGECKCLGTSCGDAGAPSCNGYCAADQACLFALTGCRCVDIP